MSAYSSQVFILLVTSLLEIQMWATFDDQITPPITQLANTDKHF